MRKLHYGKVFHYAVFDFVQSVMILVQDFARKCQVCVVLCFICPGHVAQPVEIVADNRRVG